MDLNKLKIVVAEKLGISHKSASKTLDTVVQLIRDSLQRGEAVTIFRLGTFSPVMDEARRVIHPKTGAEVEIPAQRVARFKTSRSFKRFLNPVPAPMGHADERVHQRMDEASDSMDQKVQETPHVSDKRFALRIPVPDGAVIVHGIDAFDQPFQSQGIDISMHGIRFYAPGKSVQRITQVEFPKHNVVLQVKRAGIHRQDDKETVVVFSEFEHDVDDWMRWIELMTRLHEEG